MARQVVSSGSHRLSQVANDELMNIDDALVNVAEGAGIKRGKNGYTITKGGKLSFKGFLRKVRGVAKTILTKGAPVLKPLLNVGAQSLGTLLGGPVGAKIAGVVADHGYDALSNGLGLRKRRAVGGKIHLGALNNVVREARHVVGLGVGQKKGSAEAKARMAKVRAGKSHGGALMPSGYY